LSVEAARVSVETAYATARGIAVRKPRKSLREVASVDSRVLISIVSRS
jgi:hypothetical protein